MHVSYTQPTYYIDADHPAVINFAQATVENRSGPEDRAVALFYAVRDGCRYNPYALSLDKKSFQASYTLAAAQGFCVPKAILLTAAARAVGIPARLGFGNVKNHLATRRLRQMMGTDLFVFHGYAELYLHDRWIKATPAFNLSLCKKFAIHPLDFDGRSDALFHPYDQHGQRHMEYIHNYGAFADFPLELMLSEWKKYYPAWFNLVNESGPSVNGDLEKEREEDLAGK